MSYIWLNMAQSFVNDNFLFRQADLLMEQSLCLEAVFLLLVHTLLHGLVAADVPLHLTTGGAQLFLPAVVAHLPLHRLALLVVDVVLRLLRPLPGLQLAGLHRLAVAVLLLHRVGKLVGELLAVLAHPRLAHLLTDLARCVVALLGGHLVAADAALAVLVLCLPALKVDAEDAGAVLHNLLLVPAVLVLHVD